MKLIDELNYTKTHEWVKWLDENTALIGITDHAQEALGDIVFLNLPEAGDQLTVNTAFGDIESVKAVSEVYAPLSGIVRKVNTALLDHPELINSDAYGSWLLEIGTITAKADFLSAEAYERIAAEE